MNDNNKKISGVALAFVTFVLAWGFIYLHIKREEHFKEIEKGYISGGTINLSKPDEKTQAKLVNNLTNLLVNGNYIKTQKDAQYISQHIFDKLKNGAEFENLGALNLRRFAIVADSVDKKEFPDLQKRVQQSRNNLQLPDSLRELDALYMKNTNSTVNLQNGNGKISVRIDSIPKEGILHKIKREKPQPLAGRLVKLTQYNVITEDSLKNFLAKNEEERDSLIIKSVTFAQTDKNGIAIFEGLDENGFYSVLPLKKGFEYGKEKGTASKSLGNKVLKISFTERIHTIAPFGTLTYQQLKTDEVLTVRTPTEYEHLYRNYVILFFFFWWLLWLVLNYSRKNEKNIDPIILPVLMTLSGICILMMFAIHNPLVDTNQGKTMVIGVLLGIALIWIFSKIDFVKFFYEIIDKHKLFSFSYIGKNTNKEFELKHSSVPVYSIFLFLGLVLTLLLIWFGNGPEGSGVKVNLKLFLLFGPEYQPSEVAKYLIIMFFAIFFFYKADYYRDAKNRNENETFFNILGFKIDIPFWLRLFWIRIKKSFPIIGGLAVLLILYLLLGDMGPALVLAITFIIIYSIVRGDFWQMILGVLSFFVLYFLMHSVVAVVIWFVSWIVFGIFYGEKNKNDINDVKRQSTFFESAVFMNLVIAVFIFGSALPYFGERLKERSAIAGSGVWNNEVIGGDQVVQGLWGLSSGGWNGQGFENGSPNVIPAFHTDMILSSIGEVMGWVGLVLIIGCLALLIQRSIIIGRQTGHRFTFFLAFGIALVTAVQFLIIAFGSIGIIPLTGVAVPFISFGRVSIILNLAAFGVILSLSKIKGGTEGKKNLKNNYDKKSTQPAVLTVLCFSVLLLFILFKFQVIQQNTNLIRPAFMTDRLGERIVEYNPRINILIRNMNAGNIYDRDSLLLATNDKKLFDKKTIQKLSDAGLTEEMIDKETRLLGKRRFYPFGDNMFFWTGNFNTRVLWDDGEHSRGYIAERRHLDYLRGFDTQPKDDEGTVKLTSQKFQINKFLNQQQSDTTLHLYNYSELIKYLKQGKNSALLKKYNESRKERDIMLTVDAKLQTKMQSALAASTELEAGMRTSVVILDAANGEILCSANYPLPDQNDLKKKYDNNNYRDYKDYKTTNRDLGTTWATNPGSTAKLMGALAWFRNKENSHSREQIPTYNIDVDEILDFTENNPVEPYNQSKGVLLRYPIGKYGKTQSITMQDAIVLSSNIYFVKLVNDKNLYAPLAKIYCDAGLMLAPEKKPQLLTYSFYNTETAENDNALVTEMNIMADTGVDKFRKYQENLAKGAEPHKLNDAEYAIAWGQSPLRATPLAMTRVVSSIVNGGKLVETRYVLTDNLIKKLPEQKTLTITEPNYAGIIKDFMKAETENRKVKLPAFNGFIGGKSGTPTRIISGLGEKNDGWYIFYIERQDKKPLAVAVRIELGEGSAKAYRLVANTVLDVLKKTGYIENNN